MAEIDDARLKQLMEAEGLLGKLYGNTETKVELEKLAKKVNPNAVTTADLAAPYLKPLDERIQRLEAFEKKIDTMQTDWQEQSAFDSLRKNGYTDQGLEEIKKIMKERNVKDPEIAAAYWDKTRPSEPVAPNGISPSMWNFENSLGQSEESAALLHKNPDAWLDRETAAWASELKRGNS